MSPESTQSAQPIIAIRMATAVTIAVLVGIAFASPASAGEQPQDRLAVAALSSESGAATLYYNSASGVFSVDWVLAPGPIDTRGETPGPSSYAITTTLYYTDGTIIGCFSTADESETSGVIVAGTGSATLVDCLGDGTIQPIKAKPTDEYLRWSFYGGFQSTSYTIEEENRFLDLAIAIGVGVVAGIVGAAVGLAACANPGAIFTCTTYWGVGVGAIATGATAVTLWLTDDCGSDNKCVFTAFTHLINDQTFILGAPLAKVDWTCSSNGHDTWNAVEQYFYNGGSPIADQGPYDSGNFCLSIHALGAYLGVSGNIVDGIDMLRMSTVSGASLSGDGDNTEVIEPTTVHDIQWTSTPRAGTQVTTHGKVQYQITANWDFEWAEEPGERTGAATSYQTKANVKLASEGAVDPLNIQPTASVNLVNTAAMLELQKDPQNMFSSDNIMSAEGAANGILDSVPVADTTTSHVTFDVVPNIVCVANCNGPQIPPAVNKLIADTFDLVNECGDVTGENQVCGLTIPPVVQNLVETAIELVNECKARQKDAACGTDLPINLQKLVATVNDLIADCGTATDNICGQPIPRAVTSVVAAAMAIADECTSSSWDEPCGGVGLDLNECLGPGQNLADSTSFFFTTNNALETQELIQSIRQQTGESQYILVVNDLTETNWNQFAAENDLASLDCPEAPNLPVGKLMTIVQRNVT
jgi:hypothetical protein